MQANLTLPVALAALAWAGCASAGGGDVSALEGTAWRLVEFQSSSDDIGTIRPGAGGVYTMELRPSGSVAMRLSCNQATGTWTAIAGVSGYGTFAFGPLATTLAVCPGDSLGERIARDAEYVRSYVLANGRLYLSLMADAGIYVWEPQS